MMTEHVDKFEFEEMGSDEISTDMLELIFSLYLGFAVIFGTIAGIWSFTANRFRIVECFFIIRNNRCADKLINGDFVER